MHFILFWNWRKKLFPHSHWGRVHSRIGLSKCPNILLFFGQTLIEKIFSVKCPTFFYTQQIKLCICGFSSSSTFISRQCLFFCLLGLTFHSISISGSKSGKVLISCTEKGEIFHASTICSTRVHEFSIIYVLCVSCGESKK